MKKTITILFLLVISTSAVISQSSKNSNFDFGADVVSRYVWRGMEFGAVGTSAATPHIQPWATLNFDMAAAGNLSIGFWASYGFNSSYNENDIYLTYAYDFENVGNFAVTLSDYYYPYLNIPFSNFEDDGLGAHTIEAKLQYNLPGSVPVGFTASTNVKNDAPDFKSFYFEVTYPFTISDVDLNVFIGGASGKSVWNGVNTDKFEIINLGFSASKSIRMSKEYSLPIGMSWVFNPHHKKTFLVFKVSL